MKPAFHQTRPGVFALATLCCGLWGSSYPAIKNGYALLHIAPGDLSGQMLFAGWRFALAGMILLVAALLTRRPVFALGRRQWGQVGLLGISQTTIQYVFFYIGLAHASGVKSSIMNAMGVFFSVVLAHFLYAGDRLTSVKAIGCLIGFAGVVAVNLGGGGTLGLDFSLLGEGFVIIAAFILASASLYGKRVSRGMDAMVMTGWQLLVGGVALTALGIAGGGRLEGFGPAAIGLLCYLALLSAVAFSVWSLLLKHNPVGLIAAFNFLIPVFGVALSAIFLGESLWYWRYLGALILVCIGIWLVTRAPRLPAPAATISARMA